MQDIRVLIIDLPLLKEQRETLDEIMWPGELRDSWTEEQEQVLRGIRHLLDAVHDALEDYQIAVLKPMPAEWGPHHESCEAGWLRAPGSK